MSNRKKNMAIERQLRQQKRLFAAGFVLIGLAVIAAIAWVVWDNLSRRNIMTFEGTRIHANEMRFFANGPIDDNNRQPALDSLLAHLVILDQAERAGISIPAEDWDEIYSFAAWQNEMAGSVVSNSRAAEFIGVELLFDPMIDHFVPSYTPDPIEFAEGLQDYAERNGDFYADFQVRYIVSPEEDTLVDALARVGVFQEDFEDLIRELSMDYVAEEGINIRDLNEMLSLFSREDQDSLVSLHEGEISVIVEGGGLFFLIQIYSRTAGDPAVIEESFREQYIEFRRGVVFMEMWQDWIDNANYDLNERAFNRIV